LKKKKEAEPVLVRLQRMSDARHSDDYAINKSLRAKLRVCYLAHEIFYLVYLSIPFPLLNIFFLLFPFYQSQKKRVAEEEAASRKRGLGIRLLPASEQDAAAAAKVKFSSKFDKNRKDKRALINADSIFPGLSVSSMSGKRRQELESKRSKISASAASSLLAGGYKPSSWSQGAVMSRRQKGASMNARH
jgi:coiled-coil domain-containing protein 130